MDKEILRTQQELVMLMAILVKRQGTQTKIIQEMGEVGFPPKRIAELLNTSSNTVTTFTPIKFPFKAIGNQRPSHLKEKQ